MAVDLCMTYTYAHVRFDDLDIVLDFENVCKDRPTCYLFIIRSSSSSSSSNMYYPYYRVVVVVVIIIIIINIII